MMPTHLWEMNNIPHALLLVGDNGQTLDFAKAFAGKLLGTHPQAQQLINANTHPDYYLLESTGIDIIRELIACCSQTPQCGDNKVIIIPQAQTMNISASNALLKTLEEPPGNSYFILTSSVPAMLPATVRSRCQLVRFPLVDNNEAPDWQGALHVDCAALISGKLDPITMAQKWQKEDLLLLLAQMEIYFAMRQAFNVLDEIAALRKIVLQHGSVNSLLQLEGLLIKLTFAAG